MSRSFKLAVRLAIWTALVAGAPLLVIGYLSTSGHDLDPKVAGRLMVWRAWGTAIVLTGGQIFLAELILMARRPLHRGVLGTLAGLGLVAHVALGAPPKVAGMLAGVDLAGALSLETLVQHPGPVLYAVISVAAVDVMAAGLAIGLALCQQGTSEAAEAPSDSELLAVARERNDLEAQVRVLEGRLRALGTDPRGPLEAPLEGAQGAVDGPGVPVGGPRRTLFTERCPYCNRPFEKSTRALALSAVNGHKPHCRKKGSSHERP